MKNQDLRAEFGDRSRKRDTDWGELEAEKKESKNLASLSLKDIVENIDDISEQAENMKISRNEFLSALREVTKQKIAGIKEAKELFQKRVRKLMKAQDYELNN